MKYPIDTLIQMMTYVRGHESQGEAEFLKEYIDKLPHVCRDDFGNRHVIVGTNPTTLFSAHVDTVHRTDDIRQKVHVNATRTMAYKTDGKPLGADDALGCWIMMNMIAAKVPGHYIFHRGEECGGLGSDWIASEAPGYLSGIERAIAFDRRGTTDVITHQGMGRCCSDEFGIALSETLGMGYRTDNGGIFTDTANYTHIIPECTNLSSGYDREHTANETQDLTHAERLCKKCLQVNWSKLPTVRDPNQPEEDDFWWRQGPTFYDDSYEDAASLIAEYPEEIADLLMHLGYDHENLKQYIRDLYEEDAA